MSFTSEVGITATKLARELVDNIARGKGKKYECSLSENFKKPCGVFVTLHTYPDHELRGCIGYPEPHFPLIDAIIGAAEGATHDPRFMPLREDELAQIVVEVTLLTNPEPIVVDHPREYPDHIVIGEDGLIVERGPFRGLLLPQVPVEWHWDVEEFLSHTCTKAGLLSDCWLTEDVKLYKFQGQIFGERTPHGEIEEHKTKD